MKIYKTPNHLIMTSQTTPPTLACKGECKKVWWENDMHIEASLLQTLYCPMCGSHLFVATKDDYDIN